MRVHQDGHTRTINLAVIPLKNLRERCYLVLFEDGKAAAARSPANLAMVLPASTALAPGKPSRAASADWSASSPRRAIIFSPSRSNTKPPMKSSRSQSEELQSGNEELQSINEELETSKEELESANEELTTVNEEMSNRNSELNHLNGDLKNLYVSLNTAILLLGRDLTIRRFTPPAEKIFNLIATDVGRPLGGIRHNLVESPPGGSADSADWRRASRWTGSSLKWLIPSAPSNARCGTRTAAGMACASDPT